MPENVRSATEAGQSASVWRAGLDNGSLGPASHEPIGFCRESDPSLRPGCGNEPLFHQPTVTTRIEALAFASLDEFIDPLLWKLDDQLPAHQHREDFSIHLQTD